MITPEATGIGVANATFSATLVDQWIVNGLTAAFVAPGSRSTPLAVALADRTEVRLEVFHDERSASFAALGYGLATSKPAVVLCTSGTAATHFHGAVAEAGISCVPMLVCTANRPPELWGIGAPQTIDQTNLYAASVRAFFQPGPPDDGNQDTWRRLANQSWAAAASPAAPGPAQLDLSFREPLLGSSAELPQPLAPAVLERSPGPSEAQISDVVDLLLRENQPLPGVIVAGRGQSDPAAIRSLANALGWPVIADHRSGLHSGTALHVADTFLRHASELKSRTERILRFGEPLSSKVLTQWIQATGTNDADAVHQFAPWGRIINPERVAHQIPELGAAGAIEAELRHRRVQPDQRWSQSWASAINALDPAVLALIAGSPAPNELQVAAAALAWVPPGGALVVSSSMPVRDVEWFGPDRSDISVYSNRGANGIDGVVATAIGVATTGVPTVCLIGDVAFLHDASSLTALARRNVNLTIIVVNNDGGGIFSALPQYELLTPERYEQLFGTPHGTDLAALAKAHGLQVSPFPADFASVPTDGVRVVIATTSRPESLALRQRIAALGPGTN